MSVFGKFMLKYPSTHTKGKKKRKEKEKKKTKLTKSENTETHGLGFRKLPHEDKTGTASIWRARDKLSERKKGMKAKKEEKESICNLKALPLVMNVNQTLTNNPVKSNTNLNDSELLFLSEASIIVHSVSDQWLNSEHTIAIAAVIDTVSWTLEEHGPLHAIQIICPVSFFINNSFEISCISCLIFFFSFLTLISNE